MTKSVLLTANALTSLQILIDMACACAIPLLESAEKIVNKTYVKNIKKNHRPRYIILRISKNREYTYNVVNPLEVSQDLPTNLNHHCFQINIFHFWRFKFVILL